MPTCPGVDSFHDPKLGPKLLKGTVYELPEAQDLIVGDLAVNAAIPECNRPDTVAETDARREGRQTNAEQAPIGTGWEEVEDWEWY